MRHPFAEPSWPEAKAGEQSHVFLSLCMDADQSGVDRMEYGRAPA
jgi:hypothetical protein